MHESTMNYTLGWQSQTTCNELQCIIFRNAVLSKIWMDDILLNDSNVIMIKLECESKLEERTYGMS